MEKETHPHNANQEHQIDQKNTTWWTLVYPIHGRVFYPGTMKIQLEVEDFLS